jgi:3-hydroxyacyl-[acyl-carrier-protein] dehydratase
MRFRQLDQITELIPGERIKATRQIHGDEDYLRDHFPLFKVMPGVLMLESLFQASCWLIRATDDFRHSLLTLDEARNVKFADFMAPGQTLEVEAEILKRDEKTVTIKATGTKGETVAVSARLIVGMKSMVDSNPDLGPLDAFMKDSMRQEMKKLQTT